MPVLQFQELESLKQKLVHIEFEVKEAYRWVDRLEKTNEEGRIENILKQADKLNTLRGNWSREMIAEQGNRLMEECRTEAIDKGIAISDEKEIVVGD